MDKSPKAAALKSRNYRHLVSRDLLPSPRVLRLTGNYGKSIKMLAQSIEKDGLFCPLIVRRRKAGGFFLLAGFRRLAALDLLGWKDIPVKVITAKEARKVEVVSF